MAVAGGVRLAWTTGPEHVMSSRFVAVSLAVVVGLAIGISLGARMPQDFSEPVAAANPELGIHKIKHIIIITQENRSFDNYFGTYPGADGIPSGVCLPDPRNGGCQKPWVDHRDSNGNNPHGEKPFKDDYDGGRMDGFVSVADQMVCKPSPAPCQPDVMGYHVGSDIPNYWAYAKNFVLQDHMFEAPGSWSLPSHLYEVSAWSANWLLRPCAAAAGG